MEPGDFGGVLYNKLKFIGLYIDAVGAHSICARKRQKFMCVLAFCNYGRIWNPPLQPYPIAPINPNLHFLTLIQYPAIPSVFFPTDLQR